MDFLGWKLSRQQWNSHQKSANNSACQSAFIPLFVLGIPFAPPTAILLGALLIHGVNPGPMLIGHSSRMPKTWRSIFPTWARKTSAS
ncbi:MAG: tripartite tricarboxylate transporter permease [Deltaproteobacteria bacterium]|nr:tripartite tricarboxylate transporter permease [Deltaproteobacteria bacterium]